MRGTARVKERRVQNDPKGLVGAHIDQIPNVYICDVIVGIPFVCVGNVAAIGPDLAA